jgi:hypothetical protein
MLLPELSTLILAQSTNFIAAPTTSASKAQVWLNRFPETGSNTAIALYESGGIGPSYTYSGVSHEKPAVQVISRSTSYVTARRNANRVFTILAATKNSTISSVAYTQITPSQSPFDLGADAAGRSMISCNYIVEKAISTS